ncbi:hypothetical protein N431DRAFT_467345 [Stipitochalara longipes BDJ]|nr:hypothetical protein N431DRAFT_467345 [Stipitochalara longipes BDJ]
MCLCGGWQAWNLLRRHTALFRQKLRCYNDIIVMPIPFKENIDISDLGQVSYPLPKRDEKAMDSVLDPMKDDGALVAAVPLRAINNAMNEFQGKVYAAEH